MSAALAPEAIILSSDALERARSNLKRRLALRFGPGPKLQGAYLRLRRLRDETQNLLVDMQALQRFRSHSGPAAFLVPHTNNFDAFVNPDEELEKFFFHPELEGGNSEENGRRTLFQLGELFKIWPSDKKLRFRNVLLDVSVEELNLLKESLNTTMARSQQSLIAEAFGNGASHPVEAIDQIMTLTSELEDLAAGFWRPRMLEYADLRTRMSAVSRILDTKLSAALNDMLSAALKTSQQRNRLHAIFTAGQFYRINSCPELPAAVRGIYADIAHTPSFRHAFETLTGQLSDIVADLNDSGIDNSRRKRDAQIVRDARLLATIHVANLLLEAEPREGAHPATLQLVTNADRLAEVVAAFPGSSLRVPVRHPRLLAWVLTNDELVRDLERPLSIAAALLDDFIGEAERTEEVTRASIRNAWNDLAEPWAAVTENLLIGSASLATESSQNSEGPDARVAAKRRMNRAVAEAQQRVLNADIRDITPDERKFAFVRLDVLSADVAQRRLFDAPTSVRARRLNSLLFALVPSTSGPEGMFAIPLVGQLPYAVFLPQATLGAFGIEDGGSGITFDQLRKLLDRDAKVQARPGEPQLGAIMANRLTFVLSAMASANWSMAQAICTYAEERYYSSETNERTPEADQLMVEIWFARQLSARGVAALSRANPSAQIMHLLNASEDLDAIEQLDPGDQSVALARAALHNELLVLEATLVRHGAASLPSDTLPLSIVENVRHLRELRELLKLRLNPSPAARTHDDYMYFRTLELLISTHMIVWSGEVDFILTSDERKLALNEVNWEEAFADFRESLARMRTWRQQLGGPSNPTEAVAFPFAEFLSLYGDFALGRGLKRVTDGDVPSALQSAGSFFERYKDMDRRCEELSENGFARRLARAAKGQILSTYREQFMSEMSQAFERLAPLHLST